MITIRHYIICLVCLLQINSELAAQGWERIYGDGGNDAANAVAPAPDGGLMVVGTYDLSKMYFMRLDAAGNTIWKKILTGNFPNEARSVVSVAEGGYLVAGYIDGTGIGKKDCYLVRINEQGDTLWTRTLGTALDDEAYSIKAIPSGGYILAGYTEIENQGHDVLLIRTDADGNELWQKNYGNIYNDEARSIDISADGGFITTGVNEISPGNKSIYVLKTKLSGNQEWGTYYGIGSKISGYGVVANSDTSYVVAGAWGQNGQQAYLMKIDKSGLIQWERFFGEDSGDDFAYGLCKTTNGYFLTGYSDVVAGGKVLAIQTDNNGNTIWERRIGKTSNGINEIPVSEGLAAVQLLDNSLAVVGLSNSNINFSDDNAYIMKLDANGNTLNNVISGSIFQDINNNCEQNLTDVGLQGWLVKASGAQTYYASSDANGMYHIEVDSGDYELSLFTPNTYWQPCVDTYNVSFNSEYDTLKLPFAVHPELSCPYMMVDVSSAFVEQCADNTYSVNYCNLGTYPALGAFIEIKFDDDLTVTGSSLPWSFQSGNTYIFTIGNVFPGVCNSFQINTSLDCDAPLGATHCVSAHIYPDSLCDVPSDLWDGSSIQLSATCEEDSVKFLIKNIGDNASTNSLNYIVIEDQIIGLQSAFPPLAAGDSIVVPVAAMGGSTYRMIADQSPGHPGNSNPTVAIEGCVVADDGSISTGFVTMFAEDDADPFIDVDCQTSVADINAMSKRGYPEGYGNEHYITDSTDLEYIISFQNDGTDTVHSVSIVDTLRDGFDIGTFSAGAASHPYQFQLTGSGVLRWTMSNIVLAPQQRGFVKFRISQKPINSVGTLLRNHAAVYFDYTAPMPTDTTQHRVGENYIEVISKTTQTTLPTIPVRILPNPFVSEATIQWATEALPMVSLRITDVQGRTIRQLHCSDCQSMLFEKGDLPSGIYFFQLISEGRELAQGKIVIQ